MLRPIKDIFKAVDYPDLLVGLADAFWQWLSFRRRMRMSVQELKEELKESEGSPEIRAKLRQRQRQMASARMMSAMVRWP